MNDDDSTHGTRNAVFDTDESGTMRTHADGSLPDADCSRRHRATGTLPTDGLPEGAR